MRVRIKACGHLFKDEPPLIAVIDLLGSYDVAFRECIRISAEKHGVKTTTLHPKVQLQSITRGSLEVWTVLGAAPQIIHLALPILRDAWIFYKEAKEVLSLFARIFDRTDSPMQMVVNQHIQVEPGASNYSVHNGVMNITPELQKAARKIRPPLEQTARLIQDNQAERISVTPELAELESFSIDQENQHDFKPRSRTVIEDEPVELSANILSIHKNTLKGSLEIFDPEEGRLLPVGFTVKEGDGDKYILAMRAPSCTIMAKRELSETFLGERKIKRLYLHSARPQAALEQ